MCLLQLPLHRWTSAVVSLLIWAIHWENSPGRRGRPARLILSRHLGSRPSLVILRRSAPAEPHSASFISQSPWTLESWVNWGSPQSPQGQWTLRSKQALVCDLRVVILGVHNWSKRWYCRSRRRGFSHTRKGLSSSERYRRSQCLGRTCRSVRRWSRPLWTVKIHRSWRWVDVLADLVSLNRFDRPYQTWRLTVSPLWSLSRPCSWGLPTWSSHGERRRHLHLVCTSGSHSSSSFAEKRR